MTKQKDNETEAMKILKARHASYARYPAGWYDETDLLLLSQHYGELNSRKKEKKNAKSSQSSK